MFKTFAILILISFISYFNTFITFFFLMNELFRITRVNVESH